MNSSNINQQDPAIIKDFWDGLQQDIITSNQKLNSEDYQAILEKSFIFSLLYRGCAPMELAAFKALLKLKDYGYAIIIAFDKSVPIVGPEILTKELQLQFYIKALLKDKTVAIGPLIANRICILITESDQLSDDVHRQESFVICNELIQAFERDYQLNAKAGIGCLQPLGSIYSSIIDSLSSLYYNPNGSIFYYQDIHRRENSSFDYQLAEKHLIESVRLRKADAYDYFGLIMDLLKPMNDDVKRNKILEILVLANHAMRLDSADDVKFLNYTGYFDEFKSLSGSALIEFAYKIFFYLTSYVKTQNTIDYSNQIVQITKAFLEQHYSEDITLEDLAEQVNISPQYFSKLIKKTTGFNFIDWLSMLRVKKAKELLTNTNLTVKEVCFMVGYKDPNYFSRIFKKRIGITPSEYVKTSSHK